MQKNRKENRRHAHLQIDSNYTCRAPLPSLMASGTFQTPRSSFKILALYKFIPDPRKGNLTSTEFLMKLILPSRGVCVFSRKRQRIVNCEGSSISPKVMLVKLRNQGRIPHSRSGHHSFSFCCSYNLSTKAGS